MIPVCRFILDRTRTPAVQFQVGIALREAAMREFSLLSEGEVDELKSYLLNYIYSRPTWVD